MAGGTLHVGPTATEEPSAPFLILLVVPPFTLADVRWLRTLADPDDPAALLDADLHRDGLRRRWLGAPAEVVERYRDELAGGASAVQRSARLRATVETTKRRRHR